MSRVHFVRVSTFQQRLGVFILCSLLWVGPSSLALAQAPTEAQPLAAAQSTSPSSSRTEEGQRADDEGRQARLEGALQRYANALSETNRDARLADFSRAEQAFSALAADGVDTPALWSNLGNAALQAQHPGQAVVAYHRALLIDPEDAKARQNLNHVRNGLPSWVPRPETSDAARSFSLGQFSPSARRLFAAGCFLVMACFVAASIRRSEGAWRGLAFLAGLGFLVGLGSTWIEEAGPKEILAVTTADEAFARSADSSLASLAYPEPLPPGVEFALLEQRADWVRARLSNGRDVWLRASSVTVVSAANH